MIDQANQDLSLAPVACGLQLKNTSDPLSRTCTKDQTPWREREKKKTIFEGKRELEKGDNLQLPSGLSRWTWRRRARWCWHPAPAWPPRSCPTRCPGSPRTAPWQREIEQRGRQGEPSGNRRRRRRRRGCGMEIGRLGPRGGRGGWGCVGMRRRSARESRRRSWVWGGNGGGERDVPLYTDHVSLREPSRVAEPTGRRPRQGRTYKSILSLFFPFLKLILYFLKLVSV